jgi:ribonuclease Y
METIWIAAIAIVAVGLTGAVGYLLAKNRQGGVLRIDDGDGDPVSNARLEAQRLLARADEEGRAKADAYRQREDATLEHRRVEIDGIEARLTHREETLEQRATNLAQREQLLVQRENEVLGRQQQADVLKETARGELERIAGIDGKAAKEELLAQVEHDGRRDAMILVRDLEVKAREEADRRARRILATAIQRLASEVVTESTVSVVALPSDDMKGRIIGREGRNIRSLEAVTGVNLIVDDTPESVSIASFDPVRREVARITLEKLVADGRIHPASIEEAFEKAQTEVDQSVRDAGEWALLEVGLSKMHPELVVLLGRLKYRTSYGQNVLNHCIETARLAGMLAAELGANVADAKKGGLLHDIGKAADHEVDGPHAQIGADIASRFGVPPSVCNAIAAHHQEVDQDTIEATVVQIADAISASRPGARGEALDNYVKRLDDLQEIALSFPGVERCYAIQAGREVRIIVHPEEIDDTASSRLAHDVVRRIEEQLQYPGQIKVTVIRETRAVDYAR